MAIAIAPIAADDGEGTARVVSPERLVAGSLARIVVEVTVGPSGIPVGGGVSLGLHHAASWPGLQLTAPNRAGYVVVTCAKPGNLDVALHGWAPDGMFAPGATGGADSIFHHVIVARVTREALGPGDTVTFTLGASEAKTQISKFVVRKHEFHITTDVDGDGTYRGVADSPWLEILAAEPHHLVASAPTTLLAGEPFELQIRAEDENRNLASAYSGTVTVRDESGGLLAEDVAVRDGLTRITLQASRPGPQRFRVTDGSLSGRSNPCCVFAEAPRRRIFWGDIHGHTRISDGLAETAREYFQFGRDVADLDVCALTDHGHFDWPQTIEAVKEFHEPGRFVTLLAQEAGAKSDHLNLYFRHDDTPHIEGWATRYDQFYEMVYSQYNAGEEPEVIVGPHHFTYDRGDERYPFGLFDTRVARFVEVYSSHGTSEYLGNRRPCPGGRDERKFLQAGLAKGLRFGVIASSDNHDSHPGRSGWGRYPGGLVAFVAEELTREAIWQALWNRQVYATSLERIYLEFTIDDETIGGEVRANGAVRVRYLVIGQTDNLEVLLIRNNEEHRVDETESGVVEVEFEETPPAGESFYYLRVVQDNGERAWSTPIWVIGR
jgi:hypothetical protein